MAAGDSPLDQIFSSRKRLPEYMSVTYKRPVPREPITDAPSRRLQEKRGSKALGMNTTVLEQLGVCVAFLPYQPPDPSSMAPQLLGQESVELEKLTVKGDRLTGLLGVIPGDPGMERDVLV